MERLRLSVLILVVGCVLAGVGGLPTATADQADGIRINATVDGESVADGDRLVAEGRPTLSVSVATDREIQAVFVRVDGEDRVRNLSVDADRYDLTRELRVGPGRHDVTVIVSTNDQTRTLQFRYVRDLQGPVIQFTEPTNVSLGAVKQVETNSSQYAVSFRTRDFASITRVDLSVAYYADRSLNATNDADAGGFAGRPVETETFELNSSRREFARRLLVGPGTNRIVVETEDEFGNVRQKEIEVTVTDDESPPTVTATSANFTVVNGTATVTTEQPRFVWRGTVTDPVAVRDVSAELEDASGNSRLVRLLRAPPDNRTGGRRSVSVAQRVPLDPGANYINFTVGDVFGNENRTDYRVVYDPITLAERVRPEIRFYRNRSRVAGNQTQFYVEVADGSVRSVVVEAQGLTTRQTGFVYVAHDGENESRVVSNRTLPIQERRTRLLVTVEDAVGNLHTANLTVNRDRGEFVVGNRTESGFVVYGDADPGDGTPTPTPAEETPTPFPTTTAATTGSSTAGSPTGTPSPTSTDGTDTPPGATTAPGTSPGGTPTVAVTPATETLGLGGTPGGSAGFLAPTGGVLGGGVLALALLVALAAGLLVRLRE